MYNNTTMRYKIPIYFFSVFFIGFFSLGAVHKKPPQAVKREVSSLAGVLQDSTQDEEKLLEAWSAYSGQSYPEQKKAAKANKRNPQSLNYDDYKIRWTGKTLGTSHSISKPSL